MAPGEVDFDQEQGEPTRTEDEPSRQEEVDRLAELNLNDELERRPKGTFGRKDQLVFEETDGP